MKKTTLKLKYNMIDCGNCRRCSLNHGVCCIPSYDVSKIWNFILECLQTWKDEL